MDTVFDIETMPNSGMKSRLPEVEVKTGNLKDPAKVAEKIAEARAEQIDRMALSPLWGRICAFVAIEDSNTTWKDCITEDSDTAELYVIENIFRSISGGKRVITYNGSTFDLPFVYRRAIMLGIDPREYGMPTLAEITARYNNKYHVDVMSVWCGFGNYEKLNNLASAMFDDHKIDIDFRDFSELVKSKEGRTQILDYCQQDVELTMKLWNRIAGILI